MNYFRLLYRCAVVFAVSFAVALLPAYGQEARQPDPVEYAVALMWESRYVSEGRDNLEDGGMGSVEGSVGFAGITAGAWYALADTVSYDELNLFAEYGFEAGPFEISAGYTRLEFIKDDAYDNEISAGAALTCFSWLVPSLGCVYSTEAQGGDGGSFVEAAVAFPMDVTDDFLSIEPYLMQGFDFGYASDHYDGFNNFQFGICAHCRLTEILALNLTVNHSIANQDVRRDGGGDETWFSAGLAAAF